MTEISTGFSNRAETPRSIRSFEMRLYAGMSTEFVHDTTHNRIADKLTEAFVRYHDACAARYQLKLDMLHDRNTAETRRPGSK